MKDTKNLLNFNVDRRIGFDSERNLGFNSDRNLGFDFHRSLLFDPTRDLPFGKKGVQFRGYLCQDCRRPAIFSEKEKRHYCGHCSTWTDTSQETQKRLKQPIKNKVEVKVEAKYVNDKRGKVKKRKVDKHYYENILQQQQKERESNRMEEEFKAIKIMEEELGKIMKESRNSSYGFRNGYNSSAIMAQRSMAEQIISLKKEFMNRYGRESLMVMDRQGIRSVTKC